MAYLKFRADQLFDGYQLLDNQQVLVLTDEGIVENIVPLSDAGDDVQQLSGILSPGFINCHCHLELSHMKGLIPEKTGLVKFVQHVLQGRHLSAEEIMRHVELGENEMLDNGIVAVGDICNTNHTLTQKEKGRIHYHNFIEASGFAPGIAAQRFENARNIFTEFAKAYSIPVACNSIVPHAPYSVADELWHKIIHFPGNHLMTIHNQETPAENELFMHKQGEFLDLYKNINVSVDHFEASAKTSLQTYLSKFLHNQPVILVHNVHTSAADIAFAASLHHTHYWCLCPNANVYISDQLPPVDLFIENNCSIVLGTDSLASNHQLSILSEMKTLQQSFPGLSTESLFTWATSNGAKALELDAIAGSFEKGKKPGVLICDNDLSTVRRIL